MLAMVERPHAVALLRRPANRDELQESFRSTNTTHGIVHALSSAAVTWSVDDTLVKGQSITHQMWDREGRCGAGIARRSRAQAGLKCCLVHVDHRCCPEACPMIQCDTGWSVA